MATNRAVLTAEEFFAMPEDDDQLYELLDGDRAALVTARAIEGAPTLLIEVSSPTTRHLDRRRKLELYARHGVPYYWMVETDERAIEAYELADGAYRLARRGAGDAPVSLPPFGDLAFAPEALWRP